MTASRSKLFHALAAGLLAAILLSLNFSSLTAAEPKRIALLPFKVNSEKDLSFLRDGIYDMLTSRLSRAGEVEVLERKATEEAVAAAGGTDAVNETAARAIGQRLNADFVLFGSLTVFGNSVSLDAKMVDVSGSRPSMNFFDQSEDLGAVITKINLIAEDINQKLFGRTQIAQQTPAQAQPSQPQAAQTGQLDMHANPEKLLKSGGLAEAENEDVRTADTAEGREIYLQFQKLANIKDLVNGLALGDVNGDGKVETVVVTPDSVSIYPSENGRVLKPREISEGGSKYFIGVDTADINGNGIEEIFVTSLNTLKNRVTSLVLEYDGKNYKKLVDGSPWLYRVATLAKGGKVLLGQRPAVGQPYSGEIFEMSWQNSDYVPGNEIKTPRDTSLLGFNLGDVLNDGRQLAVAYKTSDRLEIIDSNGEAIWTGSDPYGGSMLYVAGPRTDLGDVENRLYLPMRTLVRPDGNGKTEVITVKNYELSGRKLSYRKFTNAHIEAFSWDGLGLVPDWRTRKISGYISDFALGDWDNDGNVELVAAVVVQEGSIITTSAKSAIIAYRLGS